MLDDDVSEGLECSTADTVLVRSCVVEAVDVSSERLGSQESEGFGAEEEGVA